MVLRYGLFLLLHLQWPGAVSYSDKNIVHEDATCGQHNNCDNPLLKYLQQDHSLVKIQDDKQQFESEFNNKKGMLTI